MSIHFLPSQWDKVIKNYELWWEGGLERPLVMNVRSQAVEPPRPCPGAPYLSQSTCHDLSVPVEALIDRIDYELSSCEFLEDGYPYFNLDCFGPGVVAAFCGAELDNSTGRVWFHSTRKVPIGELHLEHDPNNKWLCRIKEFCRAAMDFWQGQVLVGMPDLGGVLDILAVFYGTEELLYALCDEPEEVKRLTEEIQDIWYRAYDEINGILQPVSPGYSDWSGIYSAKPCYIFQSDFSYMISNDMFREFVLPTIQWDTEKLPRSVYHLDGMGQLAHLEDLLALPALNCVQWVHGAGNRNDTCADWSDIHKRVLGAGKRLYTYGDRETLDQIIKNLGSGAGIVHKCL